MTLRRRSHIRCPLTLKKLECFNNNIQMMDCRERIIFGMAATPLPLLSATPLTSLWKKTLDVQVRPSGDIRLPSLTTRWIIRVWEKHLHEGSNGWWEGGRGNVGMKRIVDLKKIIDYHEFNNNPNPLSALPCNDIIASSEICCSTNIQMRIDYLFLASSCHNIVSNWKWTIFQQKTDI